MDTKRIVSGLHQPLQFMLSLSPHSAESEVHAAHRWTATGVAVPSIGVLVGDSGKVKSIDQRHQQMSGVVLVCGTLLKYVSVGVGGLSPI